MKMEYSAMVHRLKDDPMIGASIGQGCYKVKLAIKSKGKGKSSGARVIMNVVIIERVVYLLAIYDKSEKASLSANELSTLLKAIPR